MKKALKIIIIILVLLGALSVYPIMHFRDISVTNNTATPYVNAEADYLNNGLIVTQDTETTALNFTVTNPCYTDTNIRETIVLSVYDEQGNAVKLNGSSAVLSAFDIVSDDTMPVKGKAVQGNQAVYNLGEYSLGASKHRYPLFKQEASSAEPTRTSTYTLYSDRSLPEYTDCAVRIDIIVEYSADGNIWTRANNVTAYLVNNADSDVSALAGEVVVPEITPAPSFEWIIENGAAVFMGMGEITDTDITIPAHVRLDDEGKESAFGEIYPVSVRKGAFSGNADLVSVTFSNGVTIENGDMGNMFLQCTSLTTVNNIPENVTNMNSTFSGCTALVEAPKLPDGVTSLAACFEGCTSLTTPPQLPVGITNLNSCFRDCTALEFAPEIPEGTESMDGTFVNCKSLVTAPFIPESVLSMNYCYSGCTSLDGTLYIPCGIINQTVFVQVEYSITFICNKCPSLDSITLNTCTNNPFDPDDISETLPVIYLQEHNNNGYCEYCNLVNGTEVVDGIKIFADDAKGELYYANVDFLINEVPDYLKEFCAKVSYVSDIEKYYHQCVTGFAINHGTYSTICIRVDHKGQHGVAKYVVFHELAHSYDFQHGISSSSAWLSVYRAEGKTLGSWYGDSRGYSLVETFAIAAGYYFTGYEELKTECPLAYEFIDNLFGDLD